MTSMIRRDAKAVAETVVMKYAGSVARNTERTTKMRLNDFLKVLDTIEPIMVYLDGCEDRTYGIDEIPGWYKDLELSDVYVDDEGLGVSIYTA